MALVEPRGGRPGGDATEQTILVIDDREDLTRFCERILGGTYRFHHVTNAPDAEPFLAERRISGVLVDRDFSKADSAKLIGPPADVRNEGLHILRWLRERHPDLPMLMVTGYREQGPAIEAAELGADFLAWQDIVEDPGILRARLQRALAVGGAQVEVVLGRFREQGVVGESPELARVLMALTRATSTKRPILLLGETGTGKDTLAFAIHALSGDSTRPFVSVNVAALNPALIESELFGHARGAFTGAHRAAMGKLRFAHGGTLFLNEVGDLSREVQAKFLVALESSEVVPLGEVGSYPAEFRLITATSRDLRVMVEQGEFRRDLFHRLAWHTIEIPPLRARRSDIPPLVRSFLREAGQGTVEGVVGITQEAIDYLCELPWPGNVRELRAVVEAACAVAQYIVTLADVREVARVTEPVAARPPASAGATPVHAYGPGENPEIDAERLFGRLSYRELTRCYYAYLLKKTGGSVPEVARLAGISRSTAYDWRDRFGKGRPQD